MYREDEDEKKGGARCRPPPGQRVICPLQVSQSGSGTNETQWPVRESKPGSGKGRDEAPQQVALGSVSSSSGIFCGSLGGCEGRRHLWIGGGECTGRESA
ncbi:hypothetical protein E2C01_050484 [Portunus trituberculatus]|uniref:Uncharacterized protein n=1 Tax=Portunus trituberculatus TaxID=210409 RepID=A0A5B7GC81_PORTR|nr:hypothetical protein [Portunus trituberculatus]